MVGEKGKRTERNEGKICEEDEKDKEGGDKEEGRGR